MSHVCQPPPRHTSCQWCYSAALPALYYLTFSPMLPLLPRLHSRLSTSRLSTLLVSPLLALASLCALLATPAQAANTCPALLNHTFPKLQDNTPMNLCDYTGKVVLVVNVASKCGFTKQYDGLEALYAKYQKRGLVVLGFPSNQFGEQEPGNNTQIAEFCRSTYGVQFPMVGKSDVKGDNVNPFYRMLIKQSGTTPKWNFYKYLIARNGKVVDSFSSLSSPEGLADDIEKLL